MTATASPRALYAALAAATLSAALCVFQWSELLVVQGGGTSVCSLNETVNCAAVWTTPAAVELHRLTRLPVAGLGLVWSLCATTLCLVWFWRHRTKAQAKDIVAALQVTAVTGVIACVGLAVVAAMAGAVCLTCLGTYVLTGAFATAVYVGSPSPKLAPLPDVGRGLVWALAAASVAYALLLYPGSKTSHGKDLLAPKVDVDLAAEMARLNEGQKRAVQEGLTQWSQAPRQDLGQYAVRERLGPADAPVHIVDFTDILCPHCKSLVQTLSTIHEALGDKFSLEARFFPLDGQCNKIISQKGSDGVRCLAAQVQICLEGTADFWPVHHKLFDASPALTVDSIMTIASSGSTSRQSLEACVKSPATQAKLDDDIAYAMRFNPSGTPVLVINDREAIPAPPLIVGLILAGGNPSDPALAPLRPSP